MLQERRLEISRDKWKGKAVLRGDELRESRKDRRRERERTQDLKDEVRRLSKELKKKTKVRQPLH